MLIGLKPLLKTSPTRLIRGLTLVHCAVAAATSPTSSAAVRDKGPRFTTLTAQPACAMSSSASTALPDASAVQAFWLGDLNEEGLAPSSVSRKWFMKDAAFDEEIKAKFLTLHGAIMAGEKDSWLETAEGCMAYIIVLDQLSRNMFRGSAASFASDAKALAAAKLAISAGFDKAFGAHPRTFLYMPFMHSEALEDQETCVQLFQAMEKEAEAKGAEAVRSMAAGHVKYAMMHRDIVAKWGRFPHRNAVLGRESTPEELHFLTQPGSSF